MVLRRDNPGRRGREGVERVRRGKECGGGGEEEKKARRRKLKLKKDERRRILRESKQLVCRRKGGEEGGGKGEVGVRILATGQSSSIRHGF